MVKEGNTAGVRSSSSRAQLLSPKRVGSRAPVLFQPTAEAVAAATFRGGGGGGGGGGGEEEEEVHVSVF